MSMLDSLFAYMERGMGYSIGMTQEVGPKGRGILERAGYETRTFGTKHYEFAPRKDGVRTIASVQASNIRTESGSLLKSAGYDAKGGMTRGLLGPALGIGFSGYMIAQGYSENGMQGAFDAAVLDVSASAGIAKFSFNRTQVGSDIATKAPINKVTPVKAWTPFGKSAMLGSVGLGLGAYAGAAMGQEVLGTPGAIAGGFAGAGMMRFAGKHPIYAAGAALVAGTVSYVGKGTYQMLKTGYRRKRDRIGLETAGDTSAFFTRQAVTMRQRAMNAIHKSHLNARSALGQEATFMHMPEKNYFSTYMR